MKCARTCWNGKHAQAVTAHTKHIQRLPMGRLLKGEIMSSSFLEIVELEDGEYALQRMDSEEEPLVIVRFSDEVGEYLKEHQPAIAKAMIGAGVQAASNLSKAMLEAEEKGEVSQTLH